MKLFEFISRLNENEQKVLFEINFNDPAVTKDVLDAPISCGFEAETVWEQLGEAKISMTDSFWDEDVQDILMPRDGDNIISTYYDWLSEQDIFDEIYSDLMKDYIKENFDAYLEDYLDTQDIDDDDVTEFRDEYLEENSRPTKYHSRIDDLARSDDIEQWRELYVRENLEREYEEWLREKAEDEEDFHSQAIETASEYTTVDDWVAREYGNLYIMLDDFGVEPDNSSLYSLDAVAEKLQEWGGSKFDEFVTGGYHQGAGDVKQSTWRIEPDSSIDTDDGIGAEIISPVYDTPREMLKEMESLFNFLKDNNVETNESTGLHVTMSYNEKTEEPLNQLKVALLLGDKHLLDQFERLNNQYTVSQMDRMESILRNAMEADRDIGQFEKVEALLRNRLASQKFRSVHFKDLLNPRGNELVEFRIMGGDNYILLTNKVRQAVIRYAVVLQAGYDPEAWRKDYIKALARLLNQAKKDPSVGEEETMFIKDSLPAKAILSLTPSSEYGTVVFNLNDAYRSGGDTDYGKMRFLEAIARLANAASENRLRTALTAKKIMLIRQAFKEFNTTPKELLITKRNALSNLYSNRYSDNDDDRQVLIKLRDGLVKLLGTKQKIETPTPMRTIDVREDMYLYARKDIVSSQLSQHLSKDDFRTLNKQAHELVTSLDGYTEEQKKVIKGMIESSYDMSINDFVWIPREKIESEGSRLKEVWEKNGVKINFEGRLTPTVDELIDTID